MGRSEQRRDGPLLGLERRRESECRTTLVARTAQLRRQPSDPPRMNEKGIDQPSLPRRARSAIGVEMTLHDLQPRLDTLALEEPAKIDRDQDATVDRVLAVAVPASVLDLESPARGAEVSLKDAVELGTDVIGAVRNRLDCSGNGVRALGRRFRHPPKEPSKHR